MTQTDALAEVPVTASATLAVTAKNTQPPLSKPTVITSTSTRASTAATAAAAAAASNTSQMVTRGGPAQSQSAAPAVALRTTTATSTTKSKKKKPAAVTLTATSSSSDKGAQGENTGRWTAEEHRLFLQGLEQHGKGWKKIASLIKSRTVVQIRTHAQKYFQKLAKARQNGEEGDVTMEGRGGVSSVASASTAVAAQSNKRRRQTTGTKRKAIQSVVASAQREGKKLATGHNPVPPLPAVAPMLAHFVLPNAAGNDAINQTQAQSCVPSISAQQGTISGPALEDSMCVGFKGLLAFVVLFCVHSSHDTYPSPCSLYLFSFRFLTPAPVQSAEPMVNDVARQAGANPITLPTENPSAAPTIAGEISPTGVADLSIYPSWTDAKDTPSWYAKGADVDALLDVGDSLDWLADTGDLHEAYQPTGDIDVDDNAGDEVVVDDDNPEPDQITKSIHGGDLGDSCALNNTSVATLPHVDSNVESVVPPLPSLFEGTNCDDDDDKKPDISSSSIVDIPILNKSLPSEPVIHNGDEDDDHLEVFDNPMDDFMSTILESGHESSASLPLLN